MMPGDRAALARDAQQAGELAGHLDSAARQICARMGLDPKVIPLALCMALVGSGAPKRAVGHVLRLLYRLEEERS